jgi:hypothetical protein
MLRLKAATASVSTQVTTLPRISVRPFVGALPAYGARPPRPSRPGHRPVAAEDLERYARRVAR